MANTAVEKKLPDHVEEKVNAVLRKQRTVMEIGGAKTENTIQKSPTGAKTEQDAQVKNSAEKSEKDAQIKKSAEKSEQDAQIKKSAEKCINTAHEEAKDAKLVAMDTSVQKSEQTAEGATADTNKEHNTKHDEQDLKPESQSTEKRNQNLSKVTTDAGVVPPPPELEADKKTSEPSIQTHVQQQETNVDGNTPNSQKLKEPEAKSTPIVREDSVQAKLGGILRKMISTTSNATDVATRADSFEDREISWKGQNDGEEGGDRKHDLNEQDSSDFTYHEFLPKFSIEEHEIEMLQKIQSTLSTDFGSRSVSRKEMPSTMQKQPNSFFGFCGYC